MSTIARTYGASTANPVATGSTILAAHINTDLDTIYADYNGGITNANISAAAAVTMTKMANYSAPAAATPTFYKNDNSTTFTWTTTNIRVEQVGKRVSGQATLITPSAAPGFNMYFTSPAGTATVTAGQNKLVGTGYWTGTGAAATGSLLGVEWNDAAARFHVFDQSGITLPANMTAYIIFNYEVN